MRGWGVGRWLAWMMWVVGVTSPADAQVLIPVTAAPEGNLYFAAPYRPGWIAIGAEMAYLAAHGGGRV